MILFLHHRYRVAGGEERAVEDLMWLVREYLHEDAELLQRASAQIGAATAGVGLLAGGLSSDQVERAVRRTGARLVHAHNLTPTFGWRALAAARRAGAKVVLHLHQYRLVCAVGVCFTDGAECTRCHGRNTLPGLLHNCRGSRIESLAYAASLARWQRTLVRQADVCVVPSRYAREHLKRLNAPLDRVRILPNLTRTIAAPAPRPTGPAVITTRLAPEKGIDVAIEACRRVGIPLVVAGDGPERQRLADAAPDVTFLGHLDRPQLAALWSDAAIALVPSLSAETFGLSAAEALAAGVPVVASNIGALPELVPHDWLVPPGDPDVLASVMQLVLRDPMASSRATAAVAAVAGPDVVAPLLTRIYDEACDMRRRAEPSGQGTAPAAPSTHGS